MFHLNNAQREALRARLTERARVLRGEISQALHDVSERAELRLPGDRIEAGDEAIVELETGIEMAGAERDAAELNAVVEALARLEAGHYGQCSDCGAPMSYERLLAQPQAQRCVRCETERERMRARPSLPAL